MMFSILYHIAALFSSENELKFFSFLPIEHIRAIIAVLIGNGGVIMEVNSAYTGYKTAASIAAADVDSAVAEEKKPYSNAYEYADYLSKKFDYFGKTSCVHGVPTIATVSGAFLQKCVDDPEKAKWLEDNLKAYAECTLWMSSSYSRAMSGVPTRVFQSLNVDANGNMSCISRSTNDPDGKIAKENAKKKAKEKIAKKKKLILNKLRRLDQEERLDAQREKVRAKREETKTHEVRASGSDIRKMTRKMQRAILRMSLQTITAGLDVRV